MTWATGVAARTILQEARGEPVEGQQAIAWCLRNRLASGKWGHSLASVCLWNAHIPSGGQGFQFSGWRGQDPNFSYACDLPDNDPSLIAVENILADVFTAEASEDPTQGADHYYSTSMPAPPPWVTGATFTVQIGHHKFYRDVK